MVEVELVVVVVVVVGYTWMELTVWSGRYGSLMFCDNQLSGVHHPSIPLRSKLEINFPKLSRTSIADNWDYWLRYPTDFNPGSGKTSCPENHLMISLPRLAVNHPLNHNSKFIFQALH